MFLFKKNKVSREAGIRSLTDEEIIARYKQTGDTRLAGELFVRYTHLVLGVCLKYLKNEEESKDAVMEIFEDLLGKLKDNDIHNFKSWLYTVAKNHCLMKLRKDKRDMKGRKEFYENNKEEVVESSGILHLFEKTDINDKHVRLKNGLEKLSEEQRVCIEFFYLEDRSYLEVSRITGYSMKQVKSYVQNGKRNLKIFINGK